MANIKFFLKLKMQVAKNMRLNRGLVARFVRLVLRIFLKKTIYILIRLKLTSICSLRFVFLSFSSTNFKF